MTNVKTDIGAKPAAFQTPFAPTATILETDVQRAIQAVGAASSPSAAEYLLGVANVSLPNGRIPTATATISWNFGTPNQALANIVTASVANSFLANMAQATIKGRATGAGTGVPTDLTAAQVSAILGFASTSTDNAIVRFDGAAGATQNSGILIDDSNNLFLPSGTKIDFNAGDVTITHSANALIFAGATTNGYQFQDGPLTAPSFIPSSSTVPTNGLYLPAANTLGWAVNSAAEAQLTATAFSPAANDGNALGTTTLSWSDVFLASGAVINYANSNVTLTHATDTLTWVGARPTFTWAGGDTATFVTLDAGSSTISNSSAFTVILPTTGSQKGFQITTPGATASWVSFELNVGGTGKAGLAVGPGSGVRDTNLYRDSADTWKTDDSLIIAGTLTVGAVPIFSNIPQNSQSAAYTTVLADAQKHILHPTADNNARTFTIDSNANVAYPIGTAVTFVNQINTVTIAITSDTLTLAGAGTTGSRTLAANGIATALKLTATSWIISGTGLT